MLKPNGLILYHGPSALDGVMIVVIVTGILKPSTNGKTGPMLQVWILLADVAPHEAIKSGADVSICGGCAHRGDKGKDRSCYLVLHQGPLSVYRAFKRGNYPVATDEQRQALQEEAMRAGAYGDPAAVPVWVWEAVLGPKRTGYTHQWADGSADGLQHLLMASCDSETEATAAQATGWRTFRVRNAGDPLMAGEIDCPASDEAGKLTDCSRCGLCKGNPWGVDAGGQMVPIVAKRLPANISITVHGNGQKHFAGSSRLAVIS